MRRNMERKSLLRQIDRLTAQRHGRVRQGPARPNCIQWTEEAMRQFRAAREWRVVCEHHVALQSGERSQGVAGRVHRRDCDPEPQQEALKFGHGASGRRNAPRLWVGPNLSAFAMKSKSGLNWLIR